ncbi:MAG: DUF84 family protein [Thermoflexales bacterium]|nr:DUF84 family protein [Thermoflexales bacterium]
MIIAVGSTNPVKVDAARLGAGRLFGVADLRVLAVATDSGVRAQPQDDAETIAGATARATAALGASPEAEYGIGLEGGVAETEGRLFTFTWCVAARRGGATSAVCTLRYELPRELAELVRAGLELGDASDRVYGRHNSKQAEGAVGLITRGALTRLEAYAPAVTLALARVTWER